jgi:LAO/AO transport system kinase
MRRLRPEQYIDGVLKGERATLARAITLIESSLDADQALAARVLEGVLARAGRSLRLGITGVPGVGKSTFIEALGTHLTRERGEKVAVLSIDPSSPVSKGSILGDKTRMEKLATDERAFIRPSPSGGHLGGVARRTREAMLLCEAAGYTNIFIETVGVGQSETAVRSMTDCFLLLMLAGAGDELQGIKRGIIEMTDLLVIHKADGDNRAAAERAAREFAGALHFFPPAPDGWTPRVQTCSSVTREGIADVWEAVRAHQEHVRENGWLERRRQEQTRAWMNETIVDSLEEEFRRDARVAARLPELERRMLVGGVSPFQAATELLNLFRNRSHS